MSGKNLYKKYEDQYHIGRSLNNHLITGNFHNSKNAYSPHALYDTTGQLIYVFDHTVSIIDAKTSRITDDMKNINISIKGLENGKTTAEKIQDINKRLIENLNQENSTFITHLNPSIDHFNIIDRLRNRNILKKLYNDAFMYKDEFWEKNLNDRLIMTKKGREYFSNILSEFYCYNESNNFLSKNRKENLFPNNIYLSIREKLKTKQILTDEEICEFIDYLLQKSIKKDIETNEDMVKRHHRDMAKSHLINILYGMMYAEQEYSYKKMLNINNGLLNMNEFDVKLGKKLNISEDDIYTEIRQKGLSSIAFKEIRGETSTDLTGSRTWIFEDILKDQNIKYNVVDICFNEAKNNIIQFYDTKGYKLVCDSFVIANKFKKGEIVFDQEKVKNIENNIKSELINNKNITDREKNANVRDIYDYKIMDIKNKSITDREKNIIENALNNDDSKTGGNGSYADIKFRMTFHLINKNDPKDIVYNQSYEHMIVNMDSLNEGGLSEHNIFLDPIKNIPLKLRISTALDTDIFMDSVSGGIDKTIKELGKLKSYLDDIDTIPPNISFQYIQKQFNQRKFIPIEILEIAGVQGPYTYLDLDKNDKDKMKIENAVAEYLLIDQFEKGRLHWFIYDNDQIDGLTDNLQRNLRQEKRVSYEYQGHNDFIKKALQEKNTGKYCICGGGSNNLAKACNSKLFSDRGYIGVVDTINDSINFFTVPVFSGIVSEGTHIKKSDVILGDIKSIYKDQLKKNSLRSPHN